MMLDTGPNHPGAGIALGWLLVKRSDELDVPYNGGPASDEKRLQPSVTLLPLLATMWTAIPACLDRRSPDLRRPHDAKRKPGVIRA